jgi:integrase
MPDTKKKKGLPSRVYFKHGSYFYVDRNRKWHNLGKTVHAMYIALAKILEDPYADCSTMGDVFDRYMTEIAPTKSMASYRNNLIEIPYLKAAFGKTAPSDIKPKDIYQYMDMRGRLGTKIRANREVALLSHCFTTAIRWGVLESNPCKQVRKFPEKRRDRYVTDDEFILLYNVAPPVIQGAMKLAYITGLRKGDVLKIKLADITEEGIFIHISKTKKKILIQWNDDLRGVVAQIKRIKKKILGMYLFTNKKGEPYTPTGFDSIWKRAMDKAKKEGLQESFRFHDMRRKAATDAESQRGREYARQLLGHTNQQTTDIYISGTRRIKPLKNLSNLKN